jgi:hypothetical protein
MVSFSFADAGIPCYSVIKIILYQLLDNRKKTVIIGFEKQNTF